MLFLHSSYPIRTNPPCPVPYHFSQPYGIGAAGPVSTQTHALSQTHPAAAEAPPLHGSQISALQTPVPNHACSPAPTPAPAAVISVAPSLTVPQTPTTCENVLFMAHPYTSTSSKHRDQMETDGKLTIQSQLEASLQAAPTPTTTPTRFSSLSSLSLSPCFTCLPLLFMRFSSVVSHPSYLNPSPPNPVPPPVPTYEPYEPQAGPISGTHVAGSESCSSDALAAQLTRWSPAAFGKRI